VPWAAPGALPVSHCASHVVRHLRGLTSTGGLAARVDATVERRDHHVCTMVSALHRCFGWLLSPPPWSRAPAVVSDSAGSRSQRPPTAFDCRIQPAQWPVLPATENSCLVRCVHTSGPGNSGCRASRLCCHHNAPRASGLTTECQRASELCELSSRHSTSKFRAGGSRASEFRAKYQLAARVDTTVERRDHHVCGIFQAVCDSSVFSGLLM